MDTKKVLALWKELSACIADEISRNEEFSQKIGILLENEGITIKPKKSNRRAQAKIDPFSLFEQGAEILKAALRKLDIEELKDVIAANGMDTAKLAMKWKDRDRLENHIIDMTQQRASRGNAFWNTTNKEKKTIKRGKLIYSSKNEHSGYGAGSGDTERYEYECPCGKGIILEEHDNIPGFRDHDVLIQCPECSKKYTINTSKGVRDWELEEQ